VNRKGEWGGITIGEDEEGDIGEEGGEYGSEGEQELVGEYGVRSTMGRLGEVRT
jgi:hypothetical protein